jgi:hypothetical protein
MQTETGGGLVARLLRSGILFALMCLSLDFGFNGRLRAQSNVPRGRPNSRRDSELHAQSHNIMSRRSPGISLQQSVFPNHL